MTHEKEPNRSMKPHLIALGLLAASFSTGCSRHYPEAAEPPSATVDGDRVSYPAGAPQLSYLTVEAAQPRRLAVEHLTGRLYLAEDSTVRIFTPVAGQIVSLSADVGQAVAAGAPLAEIHSPDYDQALADARTADANLAAADKALGRARDLLEHGAVAEKDVESAQAAYGAASAEDARAASRLALYHGSEGPGAGLYVLRSPLAGTVVERNANPGQEVRADQMLANATNLFAPLFVVSDTSRLWLQLDASESDLPELQAGEGLRVVSNAFPGMNFDGQVTNIAPTLDAATRTVRVRGVVANPRGLLKAEMYVTVDVIRDESKLAAAGVEISSKAIFTVDRASYLFVELAPGQFQRRKVEIGTEKDGRVPVTSGIAPGDRVVTEGSLLLQAVLDPDS
jgi:cobalt-zinc-cadmium efflux system membrane fusion protein